MFLKYTARCVYREKRIKSYNLWKGKLSVAHNNYDIPISHIDDLIDLNLAGIEDRLSFISDHQKYGS